MLLQFVIASHLMFTHPPTLGRLEENSSHISFQGIPIIAPHPKRCLWCCLYLLPGLFFFDHRLWLLRLCHIQILNTIKVLLVLELVVHRENSKGTKTLPWGIPNTSLHISESVEPIFIHLHLFSKYETNHLREVPQTTNQDLRQSIRMVWSIVPKAADRSKTTSAVGSPCTIAR